MNFATAIKKQSTETYTENGAYALNTTGDCLLDLFGCIGSLRTADETRVTRLFADAYAEDKLLATKCLFYARDVRGGLGERRTFRTILNWAANHHPEAIVHNIPLIGFFGRFDDLYELIDTPLEKDMWEYMKSVFEADLLAMKNNKPCSLMAKWLKRVNSHTKSKILGIATAKAFGLKNSVYRKKVAALNNYIKTVEVKMCAQNWGEIDYSAVPSKASLRYKNAFRNHDSDRYNRWLQSIARGEAKVNASTLYPYDLIEKYCDRGYYVRGGEDPLIEAQWKALPNYVKGEVNAIVIADTSGSMIGRPLCSAIGLAIYFAERNKGSYHNLWMSFSADSDIQVLKGETLYQKLANLNYRNWGMNTNLERAFMRILDIAIKNHVPKDQMVKSLIVISDMEIDSAERSGWTFYDIMRSKYRKYGYEIPNVVFWNVDSRNDVFHADKNRKGVQLCSGQSPSTFKHLMESVGKTPIQMMLDVLNDTRYDAIRVD